MSIKATGEIRGTGASQVLAYERTFAAPIEDVWASITEPDRLNRWIGTWTGESGAGKTVAFTMTAEGAVEPEDVDIIECEPPRRLALRMMPNPQQTWEIDLSLSHADGVTTLVFAHSIKRGDDLGDFGPGWEYYLDRAVAAFEGRPFAAWDDYPPAVQSYYKALSGTVV